MTEDPWKVPDHEPEKTESRRNAGWKPEGYDRRRDPTERREYLRSLRQQHRRALEQMDEPEAHQPKLVRLMAFLVGMALLLFGLSLAFPLTGGVDPYLVRSLIILLIFGSGAAYFSRASLLKIAKVAGLWFIIIFGISLFYLYRSDLGNRFMASIDPAGVVSTDEGLIVHRSRDGHFWVRAHMNGAQLNMMVDTGASNIVLSPADAERAGFYSDSLSFTGIAQTANGSVKFARATADSLSFGDATFYDIPVTINGTPMNGSLLGMTALQRFQSVEFHGDTLILRR